MDEKKDAVQNRVRKNSKKKGADTKIIVICVLVLIAVMAVSAVVAGVFDLSLFSLGNKNARGEMIYSLKADSIKGMYEYSSGVVFLTDTSVEYIDTSGKTVSSNSHMYSSPVIKANGKTVMLYDKGAKTFRIERNAAVYNEYTVNSEITTAAVGKKDNYAYVLNDDNGFQSRLFVYSYQGKKQFEWGSAADYCVAVALSDNAKSVAVAMLEVKNGEYQTKVIGFDFKKSEPNFTAVIPDSTVYHLQYIDNKSVAALTDKGIFVINIDGEMQKKSEFQSSELRASSCASKGLASVAVARHGNEKDSLVSVFNKEFELAFEHEFDAEVVDVCTSKNFAAVILNDSIVIYNSENEVISNITVGEQCVDAVFSGRTLFVSTVSGIYSFDAYTDIDLTAVEQDTAVTESKE